MTWRPPVESEDLRVELDHDRAARDHWDAFPASAKKAMLWWLKCAKRPEARAKRLTEIVTQAADGRRAQG